MLKTQPNSQEFMTNKRTILVVAPILPGKAEAWRRFIQEMWGSRRREYEASRRRLGIRVERAWISETRQADDRDYDHRSRSPGTGAGGLGHLGSPV